MTATRLSLEIRPNIGASLVAVLVVWLFAFGLMVLLHVTTVHATAFLWLVLPFPILITYYGLRTTFLHAGRLRMDADRPASAPCQPHAPLPLVHLT